MPCYDIKGKFEWARVCIDKELPEYQARGWVARRCCSSLTSRIWVARPRSDAH